MKLKGISVSPEIVIAKAFLYKEKDLKVEKHKIFPHQVKRQIEQFKEALHKTKAELLSIKEKVEKDTSSQYADIFGAHLMVLEDPFLMIEVARKVEEKRVNVEYALWETLEEIVTHLRLLDDEYIKERAVDIYDVGRRVLQNLLKVKHIPFEALEEDAIVIAHALTPSEAVAMQGKRIVGFVTEIGGATSHIAILAKALRIPAIVGVSGITSVVDSGDVVILDGITGEVIIRPMDGVIAAYTKKKEKIKEEKKRVFEQLHHLPGQTKDGYRVLMTANIELPTELALIREWGAEGVGLYRTEYLFLGRKELPSEEEQFEVYKEAASKLSPFPITIRTLDVGGDVFLGEDTEERNPFLGLRAIRLCLKQKEFFRTQLRAIIRANKWGNIRVMFPLISTLEEIEEAKDFLKKIMEELGEDKGSLKVGAMIETPSAAMIADHIVKELDFVSIGTNDLVQYTLAVDRGNEHVAYLFSPFHPSIIRLIKFIIECAHKCGKWVSMCGEMASIPECAPLLLGLGLDEFSMAPESIPAVKKVIREFTLEEAKELSKHILSLKKEEEVKEALKEVLRRKNV